jgi:hypothetical protein
LEKTPLFDSVWSGERVEAGAAAHDLTEGLGEVAKGRVADFKGGLGDVEFAGLEKFSGAFRAEFAEVLGNGHASLGGKGAAEMEGAASDFAADFLEGERLDEVLTEESNDLFDTFAGDALLAVAKEFIFATAVEEKFGHRFEDLALQPKGTGALQDGRLEKIGDALFLHRSQALDFGKARSRTATKNGFDERMQGAIGASKAVAEKISGEFEGKKAMAVGGTAPGAQLVVAREVKAGGHGGEVHACGAVADGAVAFKVEAEFETLGMEAAGPLEASRQLEIVPLDADAEIVEAAVKLAPAIGRRAPDTGLTQGQRTRERAHRLLRGGGGKFNRGRTGHRHPRR